MQQTPDYYGTGRRPDGEKPFITVIIFLIILLLLANITSLILLHRYRQLYDGQPTKGSEQMNASSESLPQSASHNEVKTFVGANGKVSLGVVLSELEEKQRRFWSLPQGVIVGEVPEGSAAQRAGLCEGDVLICVGDIVIHNLKELAAVLRNYSVGEAVQILFYRNGVDECAELTLQAPDG